MNWSPARKGSRDAAGQSADAAFASPSPLSLDNQTAAVPPEQSGRRRLQDSFLIRIEAIVPDPEQPRRDFEPQALEELVDSIRARGIKQPLTVRWDAAAERYRIIDGGRRYEAAQRLGLTELPCWVQRTDGRDVLIDQVVQNWLRADLRPMETASALARLRDDFGMSQQEISATTGKPKGEISKFLAIHDKVTPAVKQLAEVAAEGETPLTKRHLYNLAKLNPADQGLVAKEVREKNLTAMATEKLIRAHQQGTRPKTRPGGLAARQRKFQTKHADVLITFRKSRFSDEDLLEVLSEVADQMKTAVES